MAHPYAHRAHFNSTSGKICHCPWGHKTATHQAGWTVEASKIDWLRENILKGKNAERNKYWLKWMENNGFVTPESDKMLPWLYNQFKGSKLLPTEGGRGALQYPYDPVREEEGKDWFGRKKYYEQVAPDRIPQVFEHDDKGRLLNLKEPHGRTVYPDDLREWQDQLDYASKKGRGVNIDDYDVPELHKHIENLTEQREQEEHATNRDNSLGEVVHQFPDNWTMRQLKNMEEMEDEGQEMGHCVGNEEYGCPQRFEHGRAVFYSLRDPDNIAHATIELSPGDYEPYDADQHAGWDNWPVRGEERIPRVGPSSQVHQFYGKSDRAPIPEYEDRVNQWLEPHGISARGGTHLEGIHGEGPLNEEGMPEDEEYNEVEVPAAEDIHDYNRIHGDGEYHDYLPDGGYGVGENTEIYHQEPDLEHLAYEYLTMPWQSPWHEYTEPMRGQTDMFNDPGGEDPEDQTYNFQQEQQRRERDKRKQQEALNAEKERKKFFDAAYNRGEHEEFRTELEREVFPYAANASEEFNDPAERTPENMKEWHLYNQWRQWEQEVAAQNQRALKPAPMFRPENFRGWHMPTGEGWEYAQPKTEEEMSEPLGHAEYGIRQWFPEQQYYRYTSTISPLYYRWVYSPSKGVTLGTNQDDHPAMVKYHQGLGGDINDTDLSHGYAYPIIGGWRLSDIEHMPVEDPYIVNQVVRALNHEEGPQKRSESSWQPSEYDWSRIHYGLPQEIVS